MKFFSFVFGLVILASLTLTYHLYQGNIPQSYIPWKPIDLTQPTGLFTEYKIGRLKNDYTACQAALDSAGIEFIATGDREAASCSLTDQITIQQSRYPYSAAVRSECALAAAVVLWENQVVQPLAQEYFDSDVARITHYGIFACRNIQGSQRRSQHATANAIDIAAFTLKDGQTISVLDDWGKENEKGRFLTDLHAKSCNIFKGVLGPNYNALHANHFHFDLGRWNICR